jgi:hypothetical protein
MDMIFKTLQVKATTVSVRLWIFSIHVNKYQHYTIHIINIGNEYYNYESRIIPSPIKFSTHT